MRESLGKYETRRHNESKGRLTSTQVGSALPTGGAAHYRPVSTATSVRRR